MNLNEIILSLTSVLGISNYIVDDLLETLQASKSPRAND